MQKPSIPAPLACAALLFLGCAARTYDLGNACFAGNESACLTYEQRCVGTRTVDTEAGDCWQPANNRGFAYVGATPQSHARGARVLIDLCSRNRYYCESLYDDAKRALEEGDRNGLDWLGQACNYGWAESCTSLAEMYAGNHDSGKALTYYLKACDVGVRRGRSYPYGDRRDTDTNDTNGATACSDAAELVGNRDPEMAAKLSARASALRAKADRDYERDIAAEEREQAAREAGWAQDRAAHQQMMETLQQSFADSQRSLADNARNAEAMHELARESTAPRPRHESAAPPAPTVRGPAEPATAPPVAPAATPAAPAPKPPAPPDPAQAERQRQAQLLACEKSEFGFNAFGILAAQRTLDLKVIQEANTHAAWLALRRRIATCDGGGACLSDWKDDIAKANRLKAWAGEVKCPVASRCGAVWPPDYNAVAVDCTHYEDNGLCAGVMQDFVKQLEKVETFNSCAIQYVDWYHAHGP